MRRLSYAISAMGITSLLCILRGSFSEIVFLSAIFSVFLSVLRKRALDSMLVWSFSVFILFILSFLSYSQIFISMALGYTAYILMEAVDRRAGMFPLNMELPSIDVSEFRMDLGFILLFISALIFL